MNIEIRPDIRKRDCRRAIRYAIKGMHFDWYLHSPLLLNAYGRYFWYLARNRATHIFSAYVNDVFVGVLLAEFAKQAPLRASFWELLYVRLFELLQQLVSKDGASLYERTTQAQKAHYLLSHAPDGELLFLAADPDRGIRGIGTALLNALEEKEAGKTLYLYTDNACTYQFYEHRGFERAEEEAITMTLPKGPVRLECYLYSKRLP